MKKLNILLLLLILSVSCAKPIVINTVDKQTLKSMLGRKVTITGTAMNSKLGAFIMTKNNYWVYIKGKDSWPYEYYYGGDNGKVLRVTGTLIQRYDLPVFIYNKKNLLRAGIPVPEGTDLKKASHRYLLKNIEWEIISE
ncbi:hypothetical protein AAON49_02795 [Pseudotenacibaculum sp. MALMAid0570]|uniref:hypothetical protein n=1 Tax=Pseudotenacibaculum sp. MALMAid0570 TaxID=3143938 RepID=UPI0032E0527D